VSVVIPISADATPAQNAVRSVTEAFQRLQKLMADTGNAGRSFNQVLADPRAGQVLGSHLADLKAMQDALARLHQPGATGGTAAMVQAIARKEGRGPQAPLDPLELHAAAQRAVPTQGVREHFLNNLGGTIFAGTRFEPRPGAQPPQQQKQQKPAAGQGQDGGGDTDQQQAAAPPAPAAAGGGQAPPEAREAKGAAPQAGPPDGGMPRMVPPPSGGGGGGEMYGPPAPGQPQQFGPPVPPGHDGGAGAAQQPPRVGGAPVIEGNGWGATAVRSFDDVLRRIRETRQEGVALGRLRFPDPGLAAWKAPLEDVERRFRAAAQSAGPLGAELRKLAAGRGDDDFSVLDWAREHPAALSDPRALRAHRAQMAQAVFQPAGVLPPVSMGAAVPAQQPQQPQPPGGSRLPPPPPPPAPPGGGGDGDGEGGGGFLGGVLGGGRGAGLLRGLAQGLGIGSGMAVVGGVVGAVKGGYNRAYDEAVETNRLGKHLKDTGTDFDALRGSVRRVAEGLNLTYDTAQRMSAEWVRQTNERSAERMAGGVAAAGGFARAFGTDERQTTHAFARAAAHGEDPRRFAVMIAEAAKSGGMTGQVAELTDTLSRFRETMANQFNGSPQALSQVATMLSAMSEAGRSEGTGPQGVANAGALERANQVLSQGGGHGLASKVLTAQVLDAHGVHDIYTQRRVQERGMMARIGPEEVGADGRRRRTGPTLGEATHERLLQMTRGMTEDQSLDIYTNHMLGQGATLDQGARLRDAMERLRTRPGGADGFRTRLERAGVAEGDLRLESLSELTEVAGEDRDALERRRTRLLGRNDPATLRALEGADGTALRAGGAGARFGGSDDELRDLLLRATNRAGSPENLGSRAEDATARLSNALTSVADRFVEPVAKLKEMAEGGIRAADAVLRAGEALEAAASRVNGMFGLPGAQVPGGGGPAIGAAGAWPAEPAPATGRPQAPALERLRGRRGAAQQQPQQAQQQQPGQTIPPAPEGSTAPEPPQTTAPPPPEEAGVVGARAGGGPVAAGGRYLVGERGAEVFEPEVAGRVVPNHVARGLPPRLPAQGGAAPPGWSDPLEPVERGTVPDAPEGPGERPRPRPVVPAQPVREGIPAEEPALRIPDPVRDQPPRLPAQGPAPYGTPAEAARVPARSGGAEVARAGGGAVGAGQRVLVGERGPEVIESAQAGRVLPNAALPAALAGGDAGGAGEAPRLADTMRELREGVEDFREAAKGLVEGVGEFRAASGALRSSVGSRDGAAQTAGASGAAAPPAAMPARPGGPAAVAAAAATGGRPTPGGAGGGGNAQPGGAAPGAATASSSGTGAAPAGAGAAGMASPGGTMAGPPAGLEGAEMAAAGAPQQATAAPASPARTAAQSAQAGGAPEGAVQASSGAAAAAVGQSPERGAARAGRPGSAADRIARRARGETAVQAGDPVRRRMDAGAVTGRGEAVVPQNASGDTQGAGVGETAAEAAGVQGTPQGLGANAESQARAEAAFRRPVPQQGGGGQSQPSSQQTQQQPGQGQQGAAPQQTTQPNPAEAALGANPTAMAPGMVRQNPPQMPGLSNLPPSNGQGGTRAARAAGREASRAAGTPTPGAGEPGRTTGGGGGRQPPRPGQATVGPGTLEQQQSGQAGAPTAPGEPVPNAVPSAAMTMPEPPAGTNPVAGAQLTASVPEGSAESPASAPAEGGAESAASNPMAGMEMASSQGERGYRPPGYRPPVHMGGLGGLPGMAGGGSGGGAGRVPRAAPPPGLNPSIPMPPQGGGGRPQGGPASGRSPAAAAGAAQPATGVRPGAYSEEFRRQAAEAFRQGGGAIGRGAGGGGGAGAYSEQFQRGAGEAFRSGGGAVMGEPPPPATGGQAVPGWGGVPAEPAGRPGGAVPSRIPSAQARPPQQPPGQQEQPQQRQRIPEPARPANLQQPADRARQPAPQQPAPQRTPEPPQGEQRREEAPQRQPEPPREQRQQQAERTPDPPREQQQRQRGGEGQHRLGSLSARYESGGRGAAAIGNDSTGGHSYGTYQIASGRGSMGPFLADLRRSNPEMAQRLEAAGGERGAREGTAEFKRAWQELARDPRFGEAQHNHIQRTHYDPLARNAGRMGLDLEGRSAALRDVVWSTGVQHGAGRSQDDRRGANGGTAVVQDALRSLGANRPEDVARLSDEQISQAIYEQRRGRFGNSTERERAAVMRRFDDEGAVAQRRIAEERRQGYGGPGPAVAGAGRPPADRPAEEAGRAQVQNTPSVMPGAVQSAATAPSGQTSLAMAHPPSSAGGVGAAPGAEVNTTVPPEERRRAEESDAGRGGTSDMRVRIQAEPVRIEVFNGSTGEMNRAQYAPLSQVPSPMGLGSGKA
jgi:hypothetical protein